MVEFNELRFISPTLLQISAKVMDLPYFENVTIDKIIIDTEDTYCGNGSPSANPVFEYTVGDGTYKIARYVFDMKDILCRSPKMLYVWIKTNGIPSSDTPCGLDKEYTLGVAVELSAIYEEALRKIRCASGNCGCVGKKCAVDAEYANFALQYFRLTSALDIKDWDTAYLAYCALLRKRPSKSMTLQPKTKRCGCNG